MLKNVVINLEDRVVFNHHSNLPNSFRMLIVGSSGCGKTVLLLRMLVEPGFIDYDNLIIYTTTKTQQEYQLLYHGFSNGLSKESIAAILIHQKEFKGTPISVLCKKYSELHKSNGCIKVSLVDKMTELVPPDQLDKTKKHLVIFDDCITQKNQKVLGSYFNKGRHNNCNSIYLSQSYFDLDRMIRLNSNMLVLFKLSQRNKTDIYQSVVGTIMDRNDFNSFADSVWSDKYRYVVVDREKEIVYSDIFESTEE
jgi:ABC-type dipeptide/oligopeptide/nickel transport system ATPase component